MRYNGFFPSMLTIWLCNIFYFKLRLMFTYDQILNERDTNEEEVRKKKERRSYGMNEQERHYLQASPVHVRRRRAAGILNISQAIATSDSLLHRFFGGLAGHRHQETAWIWSICGSMVINKCLQRRIYQRECI